MRNRYGIGNKDIGVGNEKSINQFIAHHSVIFQPNELRMWVSSAPWQLGEYVCYDLNEVFDYVRTESYAIDAYNIAADSVLMRDDYSRIVSFREQYTEIMHAVDEGIQLSEEYLEGFINNNPHYFQTYNIVGDYMAANNRNEQAVSFWKQAISLEIPRVGEREEIQNKINKYDKE